MLVALGVLAVVQQAMDKPPVQAQQVKEMLAAQEVLVAVMVEVAVARVAQGALLAVIILLMVVLEFHHQFQAHKFNMLAEVLAAFHQIT
jgi:hypothetical protein